MQPADDQRFLYRAFLVCNWIGAWVRIGASFKVTQCYSSPNSCNNLCTLRLLAVLNFSIDVF